MPEPPDSICPARPTRGAHAAPREQTHTDSRVRAQGPPRARTHSGAGSAVALSASDLISSPRAASNSPEVFGPDRPNRDAVRSVPGVEVCVRVVSVACPLRVSLTQTVGTVLVSGLLLTLWATLFFTERHVFYRIWMGVNLRLNSDWLTMFQ